MFPCNKYPRMSLRHSLHTWDFTDAWWFFNRNAWLTLAFIRLFRRFCLARSLIFSRLTVCSTSFVPIPFLLILSNSWHCLFYFSLGCLPSFGEIVFVLFVLFRLWWMGPGIWGGSIIRYFTIIYSYSYSRNQSHEEDVSNRNMLIEDWL